METCRGRRLGAARSSLPLFLHAAYSVRTTRRVPPLACPDGKLKATAQTVGVPFHGMH
jgi:hypothetical protein